jgi:hypothetical protein
MPPSFWENIWSPAIVCKKFIHYQKPVKTTCSLLWCVLINSCAQNICYHELSLIVEGMFQNAFHIAL